LVGLRRQCRLVARWRGAHQSQDEQRSDDWIGDIQLAYLVW